MKESAAPLQAVLYGKNLCPIRELVTLEFTSAHTWVSDAGASFTTTAEGDGKHRIRWAESKTDVTFAGETWRAGGPGIEFADRARTSSGTTIDDLGIAFHGGAVTLGGKIIPVAGLDHDLDGVTVRWSRAYLNADLTVAGVVPMFEGTLEDPEPSSTQLRVTLKSVLSQIQGSIPWRTCQTSCPFVFKDADCGYSGAETECDYTLGRCIVLGNGARYGGAPYQPREDSV